MIAANIGPARAPGGLVFVLYGPDGEEIERAAFGPGPRDYGIDAAEWVARRHATSVRDRGGSVTVYDGDSGQPVCELDQNGVVLIS